MTEAEEPRVRVTDNRLIDPETGEPRRPATPAAEAAEEAAVTAEGIVVEAQIAELTNDLQRVQAEYANYRRRVERDREAVREMAIGGALAELLPIIDDIDRARQHGELEGAFRTVGESLEGAATKLGLERFGAEGDEFDPMQRHYDKVVTAGGTCAMVSVNSVGLSAGKKICEASAKLCGVRKPRMVVSASGSSFISLLSK